MVFNKGKYRHRFSFLKHYLCISISSLYVNSPFYDIPLCLSFNNGPHWPHSSGLGPVNLNDHPQPPPPSFGPPSFGTSSSLTGSRGDDGRRCHLAPSYRHRFGTDFGTRQRKRLTKTFLYKRGEGGNQICIIYSRTLSIVGRGGKEKTVAHYPVELGLGKDTRISYFGTDWYLHIFNGINSAVVRNLTRHHQGVGFRVLWVYKCVLKVSTLNPISLSYWLNSVC